MAIPERTCIGCRSRRERDNLIRLQVLDGEVVPVEGPLRGRGAYLCPERSCFDSALRRKAFARAFRGPAKVDERLWQRLQRHADLNGQPEARSGGAAPSTAIETERR